MFFSSIFSHSRTFLNLGESVVSTATYTWISLIFFTTNRKRIPHENADNTLYENFYPMRSTTKDLHSTMSLNGST